MAFISFSYLSLVFFLFSLRVGVNSSPGMEKSLVRIVHLRTVAAFETDLPLVVSQALAMSALIFSLAAASSEVLRSRSNCFFK